MKRKCKFWTPEEEEQLRTLYPDTPTKDLAKRFGRTLGQVYRKANKMGLNKSEVYLASPHACRLRRGDHIGAKTQFTKGQKPWNAGMTGLKPKGRSAETTFKTGNKPHTWKPIGTERITDDGYLQRKVSDTGYPPRDWVGVHVLVWQEHHGPIPKGCTVVFKNGNKQDVRIENLEMISRQELMRRNTIHRYPPALKEVIRLAGKLKRTIEDAHEKQD
jgi:hypothetical protein